MTKNRKIECRCQCHHKHECYFGKTPCVKCGHDFASSTPEPSEWEKDLGNLLTKMSEHYLIDDEFESELKWFISTLLTQQRQEIENKMKPALDDFSQRARELLK